MRVGILGLGAMGAAMAGRLADTGETPLGFDLDRARVNAACCVAAADAASLCAASDLVLLSLPTEAAVLASTTVFVGAARADALLVDCSTVSPATARAVAAQASASGRAALDAPVSGGPAGAAAGTMAMMVGGEAAALERARPVLERLARRIVHVGPAGAGAVAKLVNNALVATHMLVAAEGMRAARAAGVDPQALLEAVNGASGRSAATEVNFPRWILSGTFDSGFSAGLMRKDLRLAESVVAEGTLLAAALAAWKESAVPDAEDFNRVAAARMGTR